MQSKKIEKVIFAQPLEVEGGQPIESVELREPRSGEMRGLSFANIMQLDVDTMTILIPRISDLTERQMINLSPVNMTPLFTAVVSFFVHIDSPNE